MSPRSPRLSPHARRALTGLVVVALLAVGLAAPAGAEPAEPQKTSAPDLGVLNEQYNLTRLRLEQATAELQATEARLAATRDRADRVRAAVRARSARLYQRAGGDGVAGLLSTGSVTELARRTEYVGAAAKTDRSLLRDLGKSLDLLAAEQTAARTAQVRLRAEADSAAAARRKLMAEAAAAKLRAQRDAAGPIGTPKGMRVTTSSSGSSARTAAPIGTPSTSRPPTTTPEPPPTTGPLPPAPPPSSKGAIAVAFARAQLGKPYAFATAGPDTFDCSGLTKAAWRAAGVTMDHYSGSQATHFPKVSWENLAPGDIVVFYADFHHVGLYIGGGNMIHAPRTGDVVKIAPAWRTEFQFGVRPG